MPLLDHLAFFREFRNRFETTGSILPSSRFLARAMTAPLRQHPRTGQAGEPSPLRILEIGPGSGAVTSEILPLLKPGDRFDLVEINENFVELLRRRFDTDPTWKAVSSQAALHNCPLQDFRAVAPYDVVISGLPFNNFPAELVESLVETSWKLVAPGGTWSFFEYMFVRPIRCRVSGKKDRERLTTIETLLQSRFKQDRFRRDWVYANVPPAWVQHLRKETSEGDLAK